MDKFQEAVGTHDCECSGHYYPDRINICYKVQCAGSIYFLSTVTVDDCYSIWYWTVGSIRYFKIMEECRRHRVHGIYYHPAAVLRSYAPPCGSLWHCSKSCTNAAVPRRVSLLAGAVETR